MVKHILKSALRISVLLAVTGCTSTALNNTKISGQDFQDLEKEYVFSSKALTESYIERKLVQWLSDPAKGHQLEKEIVFASFKYPDLFRNLMLNNNDLLSQITLVPEVQNRINTDPGFAAFIASCTRPSAGKFLVNSVTGGTADTESIASDKNGNFAITWSAFTSGNKDIWMRFYNSNGIASGPETVVNTTTTGDQEWPSVGMSGNGPFVVTWHGQAAGNDIFAQRYHSDGTKNGEEFNVSQADGDQQYPKAGVDSQGNFIIAWTDFTGADGNGNGVFAKKYNADGTIAVEQFQVNTSIENSQALSSVSMNDNGEFVITWNDSNGNTYAQKFNANCTKSGSEILVGQGYAFNGTSVVLENNGNFWLTWDQYNSEGSGWDIFARKYNSEGSVAVSPFRINDITVNTQENGQIALRTNGEFVITWDDFEEVITPNPDPPPFCDFDPNFPDCSTTDYKIKVYGKRFNSNGTAQGSEIVFDPGNEKLWRPRVAAASLTGTFIIESADSNSNITNIFAKRYRNNGNEL
jgi:hypothetical protein